MQLQHNLRKEHDLEKRLQDVLERAESVEDNFGRIIRLPRVKPRRFIFLSQE